MLEFRDDHSGCLEGEPGLAHPADAGQRHEGTSTQHLGQRVHLVVSSDERRDLARQVAGESIDRPQRRESLDSSFWTHLPHVFRPGQARKPMLAEVGQHEAGVARQLGGDRGRQHLASVADAHQFAQLD